jgi:hypothetical protein
MASPFIIQKGALYAVPIIHYSLECAYEVHRAIEFLKPDCIAVELPENMQEHFLHGASRLPDISVVVAFGQDNSPLYYLVEPSEPCFEALRSGLEHQIPGFCIDLDVPGYPMRHEPMPDPYSITHIGLKSYYEAYKLHAPQDYNAPYEQDHAREMYMARRLKELSLSYDKVLFIGGMNHVERVLRASQNTSFPTLSHEKREGVHLCTLTEESMREVMGESGFFTEAFEEARKKNVFPDKQKLLLRLYKESAATYKEATGNDFLSYHLRNTMKFCRNLSLITGRLLPDFFQIVTSAKGCVDHNYAYEVWFKATSYPYLKNVDALPALDLHAEDIFGASRTILFHLKQKNPKSSLFNLRKKDKQGAAFQPPGPFSLCSYPPEDLIVENFGKFLHKKGAQILNEESARVHEFQSSLEDGIDTRETIRHSPEKKLYVKVFAKPTKGVGSIVVIFDEDMPKEEEKERYPWKMTWLGEHTQESDMAFFATSLHEKVVGPGISRCEYGGFMMSYPPRRMWDVWQDPDYLGLQTKSEVLLTAAIDYSVKPLITYVAKKPPKSFLKSYASRFGKKVVYIPIGQLSPVTIDKLRVFHVLDGYGKRDIAGEYIY